MNIWHAIGSQLRHPTGIGGRIIGHVMRWANDGPTRLVVDALAPGAADHVLDIGCGPGHGVALLAELVPEGCVTGIDRSQAMIDQARAANSHALARGRARLQVQDFEGLAFPPRSFDGIVASNVIYFWSEPAGMIARLKGMLKPGGRLVIYATAASTMRRWKFAATGTHRWIDRATLIAVLLEGGFRPDEVEVSEFSLPANVLGLIAVATAE